MRAVGIDGAIIFSQIRYDGVFDRSNPRFLSPLALRRNNKVGNKEGREGGRKRNERTKERNE